MKNFKALPLVIGMSLALTACGGGSSSTNVTTPVFNLSDFFDSNVTTAFGIRNGLASTTSSDPDIIGIVDSINNGTDSAGAALDVFFTSAGKAGSIKLQEYLLAGSFDIVERGGQNFAAVTIPMPGSVSGRLVWNEAKLLFVEYTRDGVGLIRGILQITANNGEVVEINLASGQVDDAASPGRVPVINTGIVLLEYNTNVSMNNGVLDFTPDGDVNRYLDINLTESTQTWISQFVLPKLLKFHNIETSKNQAFTDYLQDCTNFYIGSGDNTSQTTLVYSQGAHENGVTGDYLVYQDDFEFDIDDASRTVTIINAQTRCSIDGAGNFEGVVKEFTVTSNISGESSGDITLYVNSVDNK